MPDVPTAVTLDGVELARISGLQSWSTWSQVCFGTNKKIVNYVFRFWEHNFVTILFNFSFWVFISRPVTKQLSAPEIFFQQKMKVDLLAFQTKKSLLKNHF